MKKLLFGLLLLFIPFTVKAETILKDYTVDINIKGTSAEIEEQFVVVDTKEIENNFSKDIFCDETTLEMIDTNIVNLNVIKEKSNRPTIIGTIKKEQQYHVKYFIQDYSQYGTHVWDYYPPEDSFVQNLTFHISCGDDLEWCAAFGFDEGTYELTEDGKDTIGILKDNEKDIFFLVNARLKEDEEEEEIPVDEAGSLDELIVHGNKRNKNLSLFALLFAILIGLHLARSFPDNKKILLIYAIVVILLVVIQYALEQPYSIIFMLFYALFYMCLYFKDFKGGILTEIFVVAFLAFHSYFFFGMFVGIEPHILNNISILISSRIFRKNFYKKNNIE